MPKNKLPFHPTNRCHLRNDDFRFNVNGQDQLLIGMTRKGDVDVADELHAAKLSAA